MNGGLTFNHREDHGPWLLVWGHPVYAPGALVGVAIVSMLATTLAMAFNQGWAAVLQFSSEAILSREKFGGWQVTRFGIRPRFGLRWNC